MFMEPAIFWFFFFSRTCCVLIFVQENCYLFILLFVKLLHWFLFITDFVNGTCCMQILSVELVAWWIFLFKKLFAFRFFSSWNFSVDYSPRETVLFVELVACRYLFVELVVRWFLSTKWLHFYFYFRKTFELIFLLVKSILFMELVACWFCSWNLMRADFCSRESFYMVIFQFVELVNKFFSSWNCFYSWNLLHGGVCSWTYLCTDFLFWNFLHSNFSLRETFTLIFLVVKSILFMELRQAISFTNKISFTTRKINIQVSRREKPTCKMYLEQVSAQNKFHEQKSAQNKFQEQNQFHDE